MNFTVVIPARYGASRLPGKPLLPIAGKPMIQHVYERAIESGAEQVVVATDDQRIKEAVNSFDGEVYLTASSHHSGTDRIAEVADILNFPDDHLIVNLQGDEPLMPAKVIRQVADNLNRQSGASMATVCTAITDAGELFNPNVVKVLSDKNDMAIYFSRASIPWDRDSFAQDSNRLPRDTQYFRHIGLYAYRAGFLRQFIQWQPCLPEKAESLEQLRAIWNGHQIHVGEAVEVPEAGVDTEQDLEAVRKILG